jgi:hypothetical protein
MGDPRSGAGHSVTEIAGGLARDIQDLIRGELALARVEIDQSLHTLILSLVAIIGGALVAFAGLVVLLEGVAAALAIELPAWAALLLVGAVIVIAGGLFAYSGLKKLSLRTLKPERTTDNLSKDANVIKEHV